MKPYENNPRRPSRFAGAASDWMPAVILKTLAQYLGIFMVIMVKVQSDDHKLVPMICASISSLIFLGYANAKRIPNDKSSHGAGREGGGAAEGEQADHKPRREASFAVSHSSALRMEFDAIGMLGTVFYKVQVRHWWGWKTIGSTLTRKDANSIIDELSSKAPNAKLSGATTEL